MRNCGSPKNLKTIWDLQRHTLDAWKKRGGGEKRHGLRRNKTGANRGWEMSHRGVGREQKKKKLHC